MQALYQAVSSHKTAQVDIFRPRSSPIIFTHVMEPQTNQIMDKNQSNQNRHESISKEMR